MNQSGFWWILIAGAAYGAIHSLTASVRFKLLVIQCFGESGRSYFRLAFVTFSLITLLPYLALILLLPDEQIYTIPKPWIFLTISIQLLALIGLLLSFRGTKLFSFIGLDPFLNKTDPPVNNIFVTGGLYKYSRHPIYFFSLVFLWFMPLMSWNILAFDIGVTLYMLIGSHFEEQKLVGEFGQTYIDYRKVTPWIIPVKIK